MASLSTISQFNFRDTQTTI